MFVQLHRIKTKNIFFPENFYRYSNNCIIVNNYNCSWGRGTFYTLIFLSNRRERQHTDLRHCKITVITVHPPPPPQQCLQFKTLLCRHACPHNSSPAYLTTQNTAENSSLHVMSADGRWCDAIRVEEMLHLDFLGLPNDSGSSQNSTYPLIALHII